MGFLGRFPSYDQIIRSAGETFRRFPLTLLCALLGTAVALWMVDQHESPHLPQLTKILMTAALGLPWFTVLACFAERLKWNVTRLRLLYAGGILLLLLYYLSLPADVTEVIYPGVRFALLALGLLFLAAFMPFMQKGAVGGFWQYNKGLFLRFLLAALYSSVMYIGLVIALAAVDHLFGFDVKDERYFELWILIVGVFQSWVFLSGIPRPLSEINDAGEYPKGLKVFAQFILLPLVGLYFVILISYELKIIIEWNWPKGWVSQLVLWYAVVGILSMLLLHPLRERAENKWINRFSTWYFRAMVPLTVMLFLAIVTRIKDYGVTENRFFVLALAIGLSVVVLYFIFSRKRDIRIIPIVLCALAFLSAYGPWSAFAISERSQVGRLEGMLTEYGLLVDGALATPATRTVLPYEARRELSSVVNYLCTWHGTEAFAAILSDSAMLAVDSTTHYAQPEKIAHLIGFEPVEQFRFAAGGEYFSLSAGTGRIFPIEGYDYAAEYRYTGVVDSSGVFEISSDTLQVRFSAEKTALMMRLVGPDGTIDSLVFPVTDPIQDLTSDSLDNRELTAEQGAFDITGQWFDVKVVVRNISGYKRHDGINVNSANLIVFVRMHRP